MSNTATAQAGSRLAAWLRRTDALVPAIADMNDEQAVAANKAARIILAALSDRREAIEVRRIYADIRTEFPHLVGDMDNDAMKAWLDGLSHSAELLYPDGMYLPDVQLALRLADKHDATFLLAAARVHAGADPSDGDWESPNEEAEQKMIRDYVRANRPKDLLKAWGAGDYASLEEFTANINAYGLWAPMTVADTEAWVIRRRGTAENPRHVPALRTSRHAGDFDLLKPQVES